MMVPADIFNDLGVCLPADKWVDCRRQLVRLADVPHADLVVIAARQEETLSAWVPVEAVALCGMSKQSEVWSDLLSVHASVLKIVEDVNLT